MDNYKRIFTEDKDGNIEYVTVIGDKEDIKIVKKYSQEQMNIIKQKEDLHSYSQELGGFIHMMYVNNELLFSDVCVDRGNISRLIYLATYIDYNNREENVLVKHGENNKVIYMTKKDIRDIMNLSDTTFKGFIKDMKNNDLLWEVDGKFYVSNKYFSKGKTTFKKENVKVGLCTLHT